MEWSLEDGPVLGAREGSAARHLARERQKAELRRERDRMLVSLGEQLGGEGLAQRLGSSPAVAEAMIERARERLHESGPALTAWRMRPDPERWAEADRLYEELGRGAPFRVGPARPPRRF